MGVDKPADLLQGTLELLILRTLASGEKHGYEIAEWIHAASAEALSVEEGALYPALHRLELRGLLAAAWDVSANNRRAKYSVMGQGLRLVLLEIACLRHIPGVAGCRARWWRDYLEATRSVSRRASTAFEKSAFVCGAAGAWTLM